MDLVFQYKAPSEQKKEDFQLDVGVCAFVLEYIKITPFWVESARHSARIIRLWQHLKYRIIQNLII